MGENIKGDIIQRIREIAPKLSDQDVEDLLSLNQGQQVSILSDYQLAKTLNKPQIKSLINFLNSLKPLIDIASSLSGLL